MSDQPRTKRILHVDCDAFFVQVARLADPEGAGREPLLIVGGSASGRGVVTSASYEARAFGVRSAMPTSQALRLCPDAVVVPVSRDWVGTKSREVRSVMDELAPVVQAASVDEFYLDLTGTERLFGGETLHDTAGRIREAVLDRTSISVSVGGGGSRLIAKLATSRAKPAGVHIVEPGTEQAFLNRHRLADLPGIGPALAETLSRRGLTTVEEALAVQPEWLDAWLGERRGAWLYRRVRGIDGSEVDSEDHRKSISAERTFHEDIDEDEDLGRRLLDLSTSVAGMLRAKGLRAKTITVKLRDFDFRTRQHAHTVPDPVESDAVIHEVGRTLLAELRDARRVPARLLGIGLGGLTSAEAPQQLGLFAESVAGETERERTVSRVVDEVRSRFGRDAVVPARLYAPRPGPRRQPPPPDQERGTE